MRKIFFALVFIVSAMVNAQVTAIDRYPIVPAAYNAVFVDHVKDYVAGVAKTEEGQYFGQISESQEIYGFGSFVTTKDEAIYGQYRKGEFLMGIKMCVDHALVGNNKHYIYYDLATGEPQYIVKDGQKYEVALEYRKSHRFVTLTYENGDKYVGETTTGERDGYGLYFYKDGNYYYGKYSKNKRVEVGAMFHTNNIVTAMFWE